LCLVKDNQSFWIILKTITDKPTMSEIRGAIVGLSDDGVTRARPHS